MAGTAAESTARCAAVERQQVVQIPRGSSADGWQRFDRFGGNSVPCGTRARKWVEIWAHRGQRAALERPAPRTGKATADIADTLDRRQEFSKVRKVDGQWDLDRSQAINNSATRAISSRRAGPVICNRRRAATHRSNPCISIYLIGGIAGGLAHFESRRKFPTLGLAVVAYRIHRVAERRIAVAGGHHR